MASYRGHLAFASALGAAYGGVAVWRWGFDWGPVVLAFCLTTVGGLLPDLDSDSGVPVRELFGAAATIVPILLYHRLKDAGFTVEQTLVLLGGLYLLIRYGISRIFKQYTVHRGMFHSIPGLCIAVLATYLLYHNPDPFLRCYEAGAVGLGFLSHLVLDELYSVDFNGRAPAPQQVRGQRPEILVAVAHGDGVDVPDPGGPGGGRLARLAAVVTAAGRDSPEGCV